MRHALRLVRILGNLGACLLRGGFKVTMNDLDKSLAEPLIATGGFGQQLALG